MHISALYETVTNRIIQEMKQGTVPWTKPWKAGKTTGIMPINAITGRAYSGINIPLLWHAADVHAYRTHEWLTYQQAQKAGAQVRKGEKSTTVVFTKKLRIKHKDTDEDKQIGMLRTFAVFNEAQIDGLESKPTPELVHIAEGNVNKVVENFIAATKADIRPGGNVACYVPSNVHCCFKGISGVGLSAELQWRWR
jgi:antirestriction protein ArdC